MPIGTSIIPTGYSDEYGQPNDLNQETIKIGPAVNPRDLMDGDDGFTPATTQDSELASHAFVLASEEFDKLSSEDKRRTSIGSISMAIYNQLVREKAQSMQRPTKKRPPVESAPKQTQRPKTKLAGAPKILKTRVESPQPQPPQKKKAAVRLAAGSPPVGTKQVMAKVGPPKLGRPRPAAPPETTAAQALEGLRIWQLKVQPNKPAVQLLIRYTERGEPKEHYCLVHWVDVTYADDSDKVSKLVVVFDTRGGLSPLQNVEFNPSDIDPMLVTVGTDDEELEFEAMRGKIDFSFGVFHIAVFVGV